MRGFKRHAAGCFVTGEKKKRKRASVARVANAPYIVLTDGAYGLFGIHIQCAHG